MILVSYAQYRPISSNAPAKGQANNRRIEVILMPKDFDFFRETTDQESACLRTNLFDNGPCII